jgi:hypothetical protein
MIQNVTKIHNFQQVRGMLVASEDEGPTVIDIPSHEISSFRPV